MPKPSRPIPSWLIGVAAGLVAVAAALFFLSRPDTVADSNGFFSGGIRLWRDQPEIMTYYLRSNWIEEKVAPYTPGHEQAYPPLGVLYLAAPRLFQNTLDGFERLFALANAVLYGLLAWLLAELLGDLRRSRRRLFLMVLPAFLYCSLWRFDLLPSVLSIAAIWALTRGRTATAFALLAAGVLAKVYPVLFFLPFVLYFGASRLPPETLSRVAKRALAAIAGIGALGVIAVSLTAGFGAVATPFLFHLSRRFEVGSLGVVIAFFADWRGYGSPAWRLVEALSPLFQLLPSLWLLKLRGPMGGERLLRACAWALLPFMLFGHFFSAQWIIWLTPLLLPVATGVEMILLVLLDFAIYLQFPILFDINPYSFAYNAVSLARCVMLAALWFVVGRRLFRRPDALPTGVVSSTYYEE